MGKSHPSRRIHFLDEVRGLCIILMVFYHAFYTMSMFGVPYAAKLFTFFTPAEPFFAGVFVCLCGLCCNLSRSNLKRGLLLAGAAIVLSLVLWGGVKANLLYRGSVIWFGILHCLAACILLYTLFYPTICFIPPWLGLPLCVILFVLCLHVPSVEGGYFGIRGVFQLAVPMAKETNPFLYPLGLCPIGSAGDYFPIIPWFFCFLAGSFLGMWHRHFPKWMSKSHVPFLSHIGKWSIWIYLAHQPVIYGLCYGGYLLVQAISK